MQKNLLLVGRGNNEGGTLFLIAYKKQPPRFAGFSRKDAKLQRRKDMTAQQGFFYTYYPSTIYATQLLYLFSSARIYGWLLLLLHVFCSETCGVRTPLRRDR